MPKASPLQSSFNSGELSPLLYGNVENPRYKKGLASCLNYIPTLQGPLVRRPGMQFMNAVKDSTNPPILVPFQFSITQAYVLEFGNGYIRFYANNGQLITVGTSYKVRGTAFNASALPFFATRLNLNPRAGETVTTSSSVVAGSVLELQTPYRVQDLPLLRWTQNSDTLYIVHPNYPPHKLQRFGQTQWTLTQAYIQDGPYLPLNSYQETGDNAGVVMTPIEAGAIARVQVGPGYAVANATNDGTGQVLITTTAPHTFVNGQNVFVQAVAGTTESNNYNPSQTVGSGNQYPTHPAFWPIVVHSDTTFSLVGSVFTNAYSSGGTVNPALFATSVEAMRLGNPVPDLGRAIALVMGGKRYWGIIGGATIASNAPVGFDNASVANIIFGSTGPLGGNVTGAPSTSQADGWRLGVWGGNGPSAQSPALVFAGQGYPSCLCFHQNRLVFAGVPNQPQEIDGSNTGEYELFAPSDATSLNVKDNNSYQFNLNSNDSNVMRWLASTAQGMLGGSYVAEWTMTASTSSEALTPTNFNAQQTSFFGSAISQAVQLGNATFYIQRAQRKIREMNFFFQVGTFRSTDLTELSEHITLPSIIQLAIQKETQPLVWGVRSDGVLVSMVYNRDDASLFAGWARHILGGKSNAGGAAPIVTAIAIIPDPTITFDQLWAVVKRYINGSTVYTIEYMTKVFDDSTLQEDAFQLDCGATFDNPKTISGISSATTAVVTANGHGFSNGNQIRIVNVKGLDKTVTDADGNSTIVNLVNEQTFVVAGVTTNTFQLNDFNGNPIDSTAYSSYISGGQVRKLVTTISGLTWLEGETVSVLTDGGVHPDVVVSNTGSIVLNYPAAKVQIGYSYSSRFQLMRLEAGAADGTSIGKTRRTCRVAIQLHRSGDISMGTSFTRLIPIKFTTADQDVADNAVPLFSGIIRDGVESAYDFESQLCFEQKSPLPGCIQSVTSFMEEFDV